jgi:uncharacterized membrane protein YvlD (DUF360 family)
MFGILGIVYLAITAAMLQAVAGMTSSLKVDGWVSAFLAAIVLSLFGWLVGQVLPFVPIEGGWQFGAFLLVTNTIAVTLVALALPGLEVHGFGGVLLAGVLLTMVDYAWPYLPALLVNLGAMFQH